MRHPPASPGWTSCHQALWRASFSPTTRPDPGAPPRRPHPRASVCTLTRIRLRGYGGLDSRYSTAHRRVVVRLQGSGVACSNPKTTVAMGDAPSARPARKRPFWRDALAAYVRPRLGRGLLDIATSVVPYLALSVLMYLAVDVSYLLVLAVAVPASGFLLRTYIVFHDCAHGSLLPAKRANMWLGVLLGLLVYSPFHSWRHSHAVHHATSGDLDRRGVGDVPTLTVAEYHALPWWRRLGYRLSRNPLIMFGVGPIYGLLLQPRLVSRSARPRLRRSVILTNVVLAALVGTLCWLVGRREYLLV